MEHSVPLPPPLFLLGQRRHDLLRGLDPVHIFHQGNARAELPQADVQGIVLLFKMRVYSPSFSTCRTVSTPSRTEKRMFSPANAMPYTRSGSCW